MSKLVALLKSNPNVTESSKKPNTLFLEKKDETTVTVSPAVEGIGFDISDADLEQVKSSVVQIDTSDKTRQQIVVGMYGSIKNPRTGKRFAIPGVDYTSGDYSYQYAEMMRMLVNRPDDFKKIMNWE